MTSLKTIAALCCLCLPVAACGDNSAWERINTSEMFPYGNQRTAGTGIAYVRAKLMPSKDLKLELSEPQEIQIDRKPEIISDITKANDAFEKALKK